MTSVQDSVEIAVPVRTAYNQWTQFESFPEFMSGVEEVRQLTDTGTHWKTNVNGVRREFDAEITEQRPDERIAWRTVSGAHQAGEVSFERLDDQHTRVTLRLEFEPEGLTEKAGAALGVVGHQAKGDLARFKEFIESRGGETGGWRGEVPAPTRSSGPTEVPASGPTEVPASGPTGAQTPRLTQADPGGEPTGDDVSSRLPGGQQPLP